MLTIEEKLGIENRKDDTGGRPHEGREIRSVAVSSALLVFTRGSPRSQGESALSEPNNGSQDNEIVKLSGKTSVRELRVAKYGLPTA